MPFQTVTNVTQNEVAILQAGVDVSAWIPAKGAEGFNIAYRMTATGAPTVLLAIEYALMDPSVAYFTWDNFMSVTVAAALTKTSTLTHIDTPADLKYPIQYYRVRCTENNVAAVTTLTVQVAHNGMR